jgi:hypothetical protein
MAVKTQGTDLYFVDPYDNSVTKVGCVTSITGINAARDQIEVTCLDSAARLYEAGLGAPGAATFGINFDPQTIRTSGCMSCTCRQKLVGARLVRWHRGTDCRQRWRAGGQQRALVDHVQRLRRDLPFDFA